MNWLVRFVIVSLILAIAWIVAAPLIARQLVVEKRLEKSDAIYLLAGSSAIEERVDVVVSLYKNGISKRVLLTDDGGKAGWSSEKQTNPRFVDLTARRLIDKGIETNDIHIIEAVVNGTVEEADAIAEFADEDGVKSILLVTSKYHTSRAYSAFEKKMPNARIGIIGASHGRYSPRREYLVAKFYGMENCRR